MRASGAASLVLPARDGINLTKKTSNDILLMMKCNRIPRRREEEMLIRFSFKNFKSVGSDPVTLEMVSSSKVRSLPHHVCASSADVKVLRNAVIYGGNAAGKSTITKAFSFMKAAVCEGRLPQRGAKEYCKCKSGFADRETTFDIQFQVGEKSFDYGFSCILSKLNVTSEWLYELGSSSSTLIFSREGSSFIESPALEANSSDDDKMRLRVYKTDFLQDMNLTLGSGLFLSSMGRGKTFSDDSPLGVFGRVLSWFETGLEVVGIDQIPGSVEYYAGEDTLDKVSEVLSSFDTGIVKLRKQRISSEELEKYVPLEILLTIKEIVRKNVPHADDESFVLTMRNDDVFLGIEQKGAEEPRVTILKSVHDDSCLDFDFSEESDGTRRLFDFMDLLFTKSKDKVFIVDELNRSFHPMLTQQLVKLFNRVHANDDCQLVFTTHENDIMSYEFFRRDEIWFVERGAEGFSRLYPLDDFAGPEARSDTRLGKRYLEGRYGGVPVLSTSRALAALGLEEK